MCISPRWCKTETNDLRRHFGSRMLILTRVLVVRMRAITKTEKPYIFFLCTFLAGIVPIISSNWRLDKDSTRSLRQIDTSTVPQVKSLVSDKMIPIHSAAPRLRMPRSSPPLSAAPSPIPITMPEEQLVQDQQRFPPEESLLVFLVEEARRRAQVRRLAVADRVPTRDQQ